jgi:predicted amidohydrolase YtcJ
MIAGSDFPIETADPLPGLRAFVDRMPKGGTEPWFPEERLTRQEALAAFSERTTRGLPGERPQLLVEEGAAADLVVLSGDPFKDEGAVVLATIVGGTIAYAV